MEDNAESLSRLITREIGKPIRESRGEVQEVIDTCTFFLGEDAACAARVPSEMPDQQALHVPRTRGGREGRAAGNFPVAVPSWYIVPALLAGAGGLTRQYRPPGRGVP